MRKPVMWVTKLKPRIIFFGVLDHYTLKVYRRREWEAGVQHGIEYQRQQTVKMWELEMACDCEEAMQHLKERIKGEGENK